MKSIQLLHLLTSFTFLELSSFSQNYYPPIVNYSTQNYGKEKNPENLCSVQDQRGVMYFGNAHGVIEYDGKNWRFIVVSEGSFVNSLALDSAGVIYVGSQGDFGYLKPKKSGNWNTFRCWIRFWKRTGGSVLFGIFIPQIKRSIFKRKNHFLSWI